MVQNCFLTSKYKKQKSGHYDVAHHRTNCNSAAHANWRERAAFQRSVYGRSTAGNDVVATIFISLFLSFFSLRRNLFS